MIVSLDVDGLDELLPFTNEPERNFLAMLDQELEKISQFYNGIGVRYSSFSY